MALFDYRRLEPLATVVYWLTVLALVGVFAVGSRAQGAARWFSVGAICSCSPPSSPSSRSSRGRASYCARRDEEGLAWRDVFRLLIMAGIPIALVLLQPDLGTAIIMVIVLLVIWRWPDCRSGSWSCCSSGRAFVALVAVEAGLLHSFQIARLTTFLNPGAKSSNPYVEIRHLQPAGGEGRHRLGWTLRLGDRRTGHRRTWATCPSSRPTSSSQRWASSWASSAPSGVLSLLGVIAWRVLHAAVVARDTFGRLICAGLFAFIAFSVFQNAGMTMGIMPITGIPLPFVSYGGTAVLVFFAAVGLALSVGARRRHR